MLTLNFKVEGQLLSTADRPRVSIVAGSRGYLKTAFRFSSDWNGFSKVAEFIGQNGDTYPVAIVDNCCNVPDEVVDGSQFQIRIFGKKGLTLITTTTTTVRQVTSHE